MSSWYSRYYGDYMRDTSHLSLAEHGAYTVMLDHYYATRRPLTDDDQSIMRICRAFTDDERAAVKSVLSQFFPVNGDSMRHNKRADIEIARESAVSGARSLAGAKGAAVKWGGKQYGNCHSSANGKPIAAGTTPTPTTTTTVISTPTTTKKENGESGGKPPVDLVFEEAWKAYGCYGAKPKAGAYWKKLNQDDRDAILKSIPSYLKCVDAGRTKKQFEGWINPENRLWEIDWTATHAELTKPIPARTYTSERLTSGGL